MNLITLGHNSDLKVAAELATKHSCTLYSASWTSAARLAKECGHHRYLRRDTPVAEGLLELRPLVDLLHPRIRGGRWAWRSGKEGGRPFLYIRTPNIDTIFPVFFTIDSKALRV